MDEVELRIACRRQDVSGAATALECFAKRHGASAAAIHDLQVALDEVLGNVIAHGYGGSGQGDIVIRLQRRPDAFVVVVEDEGIAFDPLRAPFPDLASPLEERRVGGLGVHFVRSLMDEVSYTRTGTKNRLRLVKRAPGA